MINAAERVQAAKPLPSAMVDKCVCSWKNCASYQRYFHETGHAVLDGDVKIKFVRNEPEGMALKESIDRNLKVPLVRKDEWKAGRLPGEEYVRYTLARHHFTEKHMIKYLHDPRNYSFVKPFSLHGAKKYLYSVDMKDTFRGEVDGQVFYLQTPNVPKDHVKSLVFEARKSSPSSDAPLQKEPEKSTAKQSSFQDASDRTEMSTEVQLAAKQQENDRLKEQLESMQSQLSFLHDMVRKLQEEHFDHHSVRSGRSGRPNGSSRVPRMNKQDRTNSTRSLRSARSARSGVPNEIELGDDDDERSWNGTAEEEWSENYEDEESRVGADGASQATFRKMSRRMSNGSVASRMSKAASIVTASQSVKSLPREQIIDNDENDSQSHASLEQDDFDNRSMASSRQSQSVDMSYGRAGARKGRRKNRRPSAGSQASVGSQRSVSWTKENEGTGTYHVKKLIVTDPYGEKGTYTGSISESTGMPHGYGRLEYDRAGRWYEGDWKHGRWTGKGRLSNGDGDFYEGGLKNDHKHGKGVMMFADGRKFEGEYINGQMIEGTMTYQDGSTYAGSWVDGMRHGRGRCVFTDESVYEGEFREGEFFGYGKMAWSDGGWYEGEWWNGEMHGRGKEVRPDGSLRHEGEWSKGQPIRN